MRHTSTNINILFKALANDTRRSILYNLSYQDLSLSVVAETYDITLAGAAKHLKVLEEAKLVRSYHVGYTAMYHLRSRTILKLIEDMTIWYTDAKSA